MKGKKILIAIFLLCLLAATSDTVLKALIMPLVTDEPLESHHEAIVILSCNVYRGDILGIRSHVRILKGLELFQKGIAPRIICTGGIRPDSNGRSIAATMKQSLVRYGVPQTAIFIQDRTRNTYDDLADTIRLFNSRIEFDKAIFVTSSYHTYRVRKMLNALNTKGRVVSAAPIELFPLTWTIRLDSLREVVREYLAIAYSFLLGKIAFF